MRMICEPIMQLILVTATGQILVNDIVLLSDGKTLFSFKVERVKVTEYDGEEIILDVKQNKFFSVEMYLKGTSWVKEVCVAKLSK